LASSLPHKVIEVAKKLKTWSGGLRFTAIVSGLHDNFFCFYVRKNPKIGLFLKIIEKGVKPDTATFLQHFKYPL
jgi:hypothetical protein